MDIIVQPFFNSASVGKFRVPATNNCLDEHGETEAQRQSRSLGFTAAVTPSYPFSAAP